MEIKETSGFLFTLISILFGFLLGVGYDWFKWFRERKEIKKSVRTLIELEIEKNKSLLINFWALVAKHDNYWYNSINVFLIENLAFAINDVPLPNISISAWDKNLSLIPITYKKDELKSIWKTYEQIELIVQLKEHLFYIESASENIASRIENQSIKNNVAGILGNVIKSQYYKEDTQTLSQIFKATIEELIGNDTVVFKNVNPK